MQSLDVISVNLWQILVSLANLILLFLLIKKFLYLPVKKMLQARQNSIDSQYDAANQAKEQALSDKKEYEERLKTAKETADGIIKTAVDTANEREKEIVANAKVRADGIIRQAENEAQLEIKRAENEIKREIVAVSSLLTEKVLEREVATADHQNFIDSFIESIGDDDASN